MNYYTIKDLETLSGIKAHTIRIWEKRYNLLNPNRTDTNIRFYSDEELKRLLNISMLVKHGYKISKVSGYDDDRIHNEVLKLSQTPASMHNGIDQLIMHMVNFDDEQFELFLDQQIAQNGFEYVVTEMIFPLFTKIGVFWQIGSIFPAQEHFISNLIRQRLISESSTYKNYKGTKTFLFFLPENEMHELSLLFYNYLALKNGYKTIYLGQNVPFEDLMALTDLTKVDYVFTAFLNAIAKEALEAYFEKLNEVFNKKRVFVTGAQVINSEIKFPSNFRTIGDLQTFKRHFEKY